ncbi:hypothetical protein HETIRDRAFT_36931, partial [Heterobasidion irregulare TC 32-1]
MPPPPYSPSPDAPSYSIDPRPSEMRLALTTRKTRSLTGDETITVSGDNIALAFSGQEHGANVPTYGRHALIQGEVALASTQNVLAVSLTLQGTLALTFGDGTANTTTFFSMSEPLWRAGPSAPTCQSMLPFKITMPDTHMNLGRTRVLPPTFNADLPGLPVVHVGCNYALTVCVTKTRSLTPWNPKSTLNVPLMYHPRTRPHQAIIPSAFPFLSTIKSVPEEWHQVISTMSTTSSAKIAPIECHLFVPEVQIYAITDTVPFFLQLSAPLSSLDAFLHPTPPTTSRLGRTKSFDPAARPALRVSLVRQVATSVRGESAIRTLVLGEGILRELPPAAPTGSNPLRAPAEGCEALNWEGEVRCRKDVKNGGFNATGLVVKDFIRLLLVPPNPKTSPLLEHENLFSIRLVTDS